LRRVLDEDLRAQQDPAGKLGLARAIAADRVDMHARADHVVAQDRRILLVCGAGGDDLAPSIASSLLAARGDQPQPVTGQGLRIAFAVAAGSMS
jgi:hypothetical protein